MVTVTLSVGLSLTLFTPMVLLAQTSQRLTLPQLLQPKQLTRMSLLLLWLS